MIESMRVLHVIWSTEYGGIERVVRDLIEVQISAGMEVALFSARRQGGWMERMSKTVEVHFGGVRSGWDLSPPTIMRLKKLFSKYDLLHTHTLSPVLEIAAVLSKVQVVHTVHGGKGINSPLTRRARILNWMHGYYLRTSNVRVVGNSIWTADRASKIYDIDRHAIAVVQNGTSIESVAVIEKQRDGVEQGFVIGTASRLVKSKRIDRLIEAVNILTKFHDDVRLVIAGSGAEEVALKNQVAKLGLASKVSFLGYVDDIASFFQKVSVTVFPAENEPFGLVALEAMSQGRTVVVFRDSGGMAEVISGYDSRNVVDTISNLCSRMLELKYKYDPERVDVRIVEYAKQFSAERMWSEYEIIYLRSQNGRKCGKVS